MALGSCIIDTVDLAAYGIFIERGGSDDFISFPDRRTPDFNDWPDEDGLDVDLTDLSFEAKTVKVNYVIVADNEATFKSHLNSFETLHFAPGLRQVFVREFNRTFSLRFIGFSDYRHKGGLYNPGRKIGRITAEYSMDDPLQLFTSSVVTPVANRDNLSYVQLNQIDLSRFGIVVRDVYSTALLPRPAKRPLERKIQNINGVIADSATEPKKRARQIVIECTMLADTLNEFWVNYTALFNNMNTPFMINLDSPHGKTIGCYYSKMANFKKNAPFSRRIKVSFDLIMQEIRLMDFLRLLSSESNYLITTETGVAIDLSY